MFGPSLERIVKKGDWRDWRLQRLDLLYFSVARFFLLVPQNKIYMILIKKQNDVFYMSNIFDSCQKTYLENQSTVYGGVFLQK